MMPGLYVFAAVGIVAGALGFAGGWQVHGWRLGEQISKIKSDQLEAVNTATREARATESRRFKEAQDAQAAAQARAISARRDADAARAAAGSLRDALHTASNGMPGEPASACHERAHAIGELFAQCGAAYQSMAEVADRLDSDRRTLIEAWPK